MEGYPETPSRLLSGTPQNWVRLGPGSAPSPFAPALVPMQVEEEDGASGLGKGQSTSQYLNRPRVLISKVTVMYL